MSLTSVYNSKDQAPAGYLPLLLATFTFIDGSALYLSSLPLNTAEGGTAFGGHSYLARLAQQDIQAIQERSAEGIDRIPSVTLHIDNADQFIWSNYEFGSGPTIQGFKGAIVTLKIVLLDFDSSGAMVFSSDSPTKFTGICDAPELEQGGTIISVRASSSHNLANVHMGPVIQPRCGNVFPANAIQRKEGGTNIASQQYGCGYDPDQAGQDPTLGVDCRRGNLGPANQFDPGGNRITDAAGIFVRCNYTKADCIARGMYSRDSADRLTGRYFGEQWAPLIREARSKSYTEGQNVTVFSSLNESIYGQSYNMVYGTQWVRPKIINRLGDGNSTRFEASVCLGEVGQYGILQVVVNGHLVPQNVAGYVNVDPLYRWNFCGDAALGTQLATGGRDGVATKDAGYNDGSGLPQGDPHGSVCTIEIVVFSQLADSSGDPDVKVLVRGPKIKVPNTTSPADQAAWPYEQSSNPVWVLLDILTWGNYRYEEIDLVSFGAAAQFCDTYINYVDLNGDTVSHPRYTCEFAIEQRLGLQQIVQQVLQSFNAQLVPNSDTGLLQLFIRQTLADQQPAAVAGSNYNTAIKSKKANGTLADGFAAYLIDASVILCDGEGGAPKIRPFSLPNAQVPNRVTFAFQDQDNGHQTDSINEVDPDAVLRAGGYQSGQEVTQNFQVMGVPNFDQGIRIANTYFAEQFRGNELGDARGTRMFEIECSQRVAHLRVGHICLLRYEPMALSPNTAIQSPSGVNVTGILVRVIKIQPRADYRSCLLTLAWHEDTYYTDLWAQRPTPLYSNPHKFSLRTLPMPWQPYASQPIPGDSMFDETEWEFDVAQEYEDAKDGSAIARLVVYGNPPVNQSSSIHPPFVLSEGVTASTGGTIPAGDYVIRVCAVDADGVPSTVSDAIRVQVPVGSDTNTIGTDSITWQDGAVDSIVFAGTDDDHLAMQVNGGGTPDSFTLTHLNTATFGPPDLLFDHLVIRAKKILHAGVWGAEVNVVDNTGAVDGTGTLEFTGAGFDIDQWKDYDISLISLAISSSPFGRENFRVLSNTADVLTVTPDPVANNILPGFVFVMRSRPGTVTEDTLDDANFVNAFAPAGLDPDAEAGNVIRFISGTGRGQLRTITGNSATTLTVRTPWETTPDETSRYIIEEAAWQDSPDIEKVSSSVPIQTTAPIVAKPIVTNYAGKTLLVQALTSDVNDNWSLEPFSPLREIFIFGSGGANRGPIAYA